MGWALIINWPQYFIPPGIGWLSTDWTNEDIADPWAASTWAESYRHRWTDWLPEAGLEIAAWLETAKN